MNKLLVALVTVAAISLPIAAFADGNVFYSTSGATPSPQMRAAFQNMEQAREREEQLHSQARAAMLNALSPAHKTLLAQVFGQLAISPNPDINAAARVLDASLSQAEGRSILAISASLESQTRQIMEAAHEQFMAAAQQAMAANPQASSAVNGPPPVGGPPNGRPVMIGDEAHTHWMKRTAPTDPGAILLLSSLHSLEPRGMIRLGPPTGLNAH
jgi:hypothetical protein